jgi:motility quorum-sensing regulator / GCU-specific mRNA interferase toxin
MEKRKAHYPLLRVKELVDAGAYRVTRSALQCAARDFGFIEASQLAACVADLQIRDLYKSMTAIHDSALWQDVYHPMIDGTPAYVKVQISDDNTVVISFKILEDESYA